MVSFVLDGCFINKFSFDSWKMRLMEKKQRLIVIHCRIPDSGYCSEQEIVNSKLINRKSKFTVCCSVIAEKSLL